MVSIPLAKSHCITIKRQLSGGSAGKFKNIYEDQFVVYSHAEVGLPVAAEVVKGKARAGSKGECPDNAQ